jgi:hypothetical protein
MEVVVLHEPLMTTAAAAGKTNCPLCDFAVVQRHNRYVAAGLVLKETALMAPQHSSRGGCDGSAPAVSAGTAAGGDECQNTLAVHPLPASEPGRYQSSKNPATLGMADYPMWQ